MNATAENPNVTALKAAYTRWHDSKGASVDAWMAMLADDINFGTLAAGPPQAVYLKDYDSKHALREYFEGLTRDWSMVAYTVDEYVKSEPLRA
jgi:hypothetical protein